MKKGRFQQACDTLLYDAKRAKKLGPKYVRIGISELFDSGVQFAIDGLERLQHRLEEYQKLHSLKRDADPDGHVETAVRRKSQRSRKS